MTTINNTKTKPKTDFALMTHVAQYTCTSLSLLCVESYEYNDGGISYRSADIPDHAIITHCPININHKVT